MTLSNFIHTLERMQEHLGANSQVVIRRTDPHGNAFLVPVTSFMSDMTHLELLADLPPEPMKEGCPRCPECGGQVVMIYSNREDGTPYPAQELAILPPFGDMGFMQDFLASGQTKEAYEAELLKAMRMLAKVLPIPCTACGNTGVIGDEPCHVCNGACVKGQDPKPLCADTPPQPPPASNYPATTEKRFDVCNKLLQSAGKAYPRTCAKCGLGPCQHTTA